MAKLTIKEINNPLSTYRNRFNKEPPENEYLLLDYDRLFLRVRKSSLKNWLFIYKFEGKQFKLSIKGKDLESIRDEAEECRDLLKEKINPKQNRIDEKEAKRLNQQIMESRITVRNLFDKWEAIDLKDYKRGTKEIKQAFERYVFPIIGDMPLEEVKKSHVMEIADNIKLKGLTRTPRMVFGQVRQMFRFALERDLIKSEPTATIRKGKTFKADKERDRYFSEEEIREFFIKLPNAGLNKTTEIALKICLSTACRIGEILNAKWRNISFENATWVIPPEDSKKW